MVLGVHKRTKEKVAIKIINTTLIGNANNIEMVFTEAETLKALHHKNIVRVFTCYTLKDM